MRILIEVLKYSLPTAVLTRFCKLPQESKPLFAAEDAVLLLIIPDIVRAGGDEDDPFAAGFPACKVCQFQVRTGRRIEGAEETEDISHLFSPLPKGSRMTGIRRLCRLACSFFRIFSSVSGSPQVPSRIQR